MTRQVVVARNLSRVTTLADRLEIGASLWARFVGLMGRSSLPPGDGLWLPGANGIHMMFMRFPIDAVFLSRPDADGRRLVVAIRRRLPAWRGLVPFVGGAHGVIELPVGAIDASATERGDTIVFAPRES
ncbi:MAG TPA: DUF192 domain-containing protein [Candidatus Limnocylindrales bacterium]|nr:DUF192 domain-containing protein [Candidatus Limnocylindrales bacterium]